MAAKGQKWVVRKWFFVRQSWKLWTTLAGLNLSSIVLLPVKQSVLITRLLLSNMGAATTWGLLQHGGLSTEY